MDELPLPIVIRLITNEVDRRDTQFKRRVIQWSFNAAIASGFPQDAAVRLLENRTSKAQWWAVRQIMPEQALRALYAKIIQDVGVPGTGDK